MALLVLPSGVDAFPPIGLKPDTDRIDGLTESRLAGLPTWDLEAGMLFDEDGVDAGSTSLLAVER